MFNRAVMDISSRTRCSRPSRRHDLLEGQWEQKRYEQHRQRLKRAKSMVDISRPKSSSYTHVQLKSKKQLKMAEREAEIMAENCVLLRHLSDIAMSKRVDDGMTPRRCQSRDFFGQIIKMRLQQIEWLKAQMERELRKLSVKDKDDQADGDNDTEANKDKSEENESETEKSAPDRDSSSTQSSSKSSSDSQSKNSS